MKITVNAIQRGVFILVVLMSVLTGLMVRPTITATAAGATLPYVELEAESANTTGSIIGPSRTLYQLAAEASGRRAVTLSATGQYVEFTLSQQANSIVVRYSIPD